MGTERTMGRRASGRARALAATAAAAALVAAGWGAWTALSGGEATAPGAATIDLARGERLYAAECAACHGAELEGDPLWRRPLPDGRLRAPPHDATGHTWHHPDSVLFAITKLGTEEVVGGGYASDMPGFGDRLSDGEIHDVLAFIKSTWPERERAHQAELTRRDEAAR